jgi:lysophospholipase L1-like esterase
MTDPLAPSLRWQVAVRSVPGRLRTGTVELTADASTLTGPAAGDRSNTRPTFLTETRRPGATYYVALGDSLATGFGASFEHGYVDLVAARLRRRVPGLTVVDLGCVGETTTSMRTGETCGYSQGSQLEAALWFLRTHRGQVRLLTLDIGGNDILGCGGEADPRPCDRRALDTIHRNLTAFVAALRRMGGRAMPAAGMTYFNPFVAMAVGGGSAGRQRALDSIPEARALNQMLTADYHRAGFVVADVAGAFRNDDLTPVPSRWGPIPTNAARACAWLLGACGTGSPQGPDANDGGYRAIAAAFLTVLRLDDPRRP